MIKNAGVIDGKTAQIISLVLEILIFQVTIVGLY
jgi:hypothetical protein